MSDDRSRAVPEKSRGFVPALLFVLLIVVPLWAPGVARAGDIGLSSVRSLRLDNPIFNAGGPQEQDQFAFSLAVGDLDGDGRDDLAIGVPGDDGPFADPHVDAGSVHVYLSQGAAVFSAVPSFVLAQGLGGFEAGDRHGHALAICDFDADGYEDLAVGAMTEDVGAVESAGAVFLYRGGEDGPDPLDPALLTQATDGVPDNPEVGDFFGGALACGDFNNDTRADLAIGAPGESIGATPNAGWLVVLLGTSAGLTTTGATAFTQADSWIPGEPEPDDFFALRLAAGDFNGDDHADLAVGAPGEDLSAGAVHLLLGGTGGILAGTSLLFTDENLTGISEFGDRFGDALAMADFHPDGYADLAIGIPGETFASPGGPIVECGQVVVVAGGPSGASGTHYWAENNIVGAGTSEAGDRFGSALAAGDFNGDTYPDLAVGHPGETVALAGDGAVTVFGGTGDGLFAIDVRGFAAGFEGLPGQPPGFVTTRAFGAALAAGDFDGDGFADLAIGAPKEPFGDTTAIGAATLLFGAMFADGFETSSPFAAWDAP